MSDARRILAILIIFAMLIIGFGGISSVGSSEESSLGLATSTYEVQSLSDKGPLYQWTIEDRPYSSLNGSILIFNDHGGWFADAEKRPGDDGGDNPDPWAAGEEDDLLCWAATCSNMIEYSGWGYSTNVQSYNTDNFFYYYQDHVTDQGSKVENGLKWWFSGNLDRPFLSSWSIEDVEGGGFWKSVNTADYIIKNDDSDSIMYQIDTWTSAGNVVGLGVRDHNGENGHAITCWGFDYRMSVDKWGNPGSYYLGIWISDSDDSKGTDTPDDVLKFEPIKWDSSENKWAMPEYYDYFIYDATVLLPYPNDVRPVAHAGNSYVATEGTSIVLDGRYSTDADSDTLYYRWDFEGDGKWNTEWSTNPTVTIGCPGEYEGKVYLEVSDGRLLDMDVATLKFINGIPQLLNIVGDEIDEAGTATIRGSIVDSGIDDTFVLKVFWGDGFVDTMNYGAGTKTFSLTHKYNDDGVSNTLYDEYKVTLFICDSDGAYSSNWVYVKVNNVAPQILNIVANSVKEGELAKLTFMIKDPGTLDTFTIFVDWGDGVMQNIAIATSQRSFELYHLYVDDGISGTPSDNLQISIGVIDDDGSSATVSHSITVYNVRPTIKNLVGCTIDEGHIATLAMTIDDPGITDSLVLTINWGDFKQDVINIPAGTSSFTATHRYLDDSMGSGSGSAFYFVNAWAVDDDEPNSPIYYSTQITVDNVNPSVREVIGSEVHENEEASISITFIDPGRSDVHAITVNWKDGTILSYEVPIGERWMMITHRYLDDGLFSVSFTISDGDGGTVDDTIDVMVANCDPSVTIVGSSIENDVVLSLTTTIDDPGSLDTFVMYVDWGDGNHDTIKEFKPSDWEITHEYPDIVKTYGVIITVEDDDGGIGVTVTTILIGNVGMEISLGVNRVIFENDAVTLAVDIKDIEETSVYDLEISWGDGGSVSISNVPPTGFSLGHQYLENGTYIIQVTVNDEKGRSTSSSTSIRVLNVGPTVSGLNADVVPEGVETNIAGVLLDPGTLDAIIMSIAWGDGSTELFTDFDTGPFQLSHKYLDDRQYTIMITVTDDDGGSSSTNMLVTVINSVPVVTIEDDTIEEGGMAAISGTIYDAGLLDEFSLTIDWGDGSGDSYPNLVHGIINLNHQYLENGTYGVKVTVNDGDGGLGYGIATVTVNNVIPTVLGIDANDIVEGQFVIVYGNLYDPGTYDTFSLSVAWGDGAVNMHKNFKSGSFQLSHQYLDDGQYTLTITVTDDDGGSSSTNALVTVSNSIPVVTVVGDTINEGGMATVSGTITDTGSMDEFTLTISWGDGSIETFYPPASSTDFSYTHNYLDDGLTKTAWDQYSISITVTDGDGGSGNADAFVIVNNVAPVVIATGSTVMEGDMGWVLISISDAGTKDTFILTIEWGEGISTTVNLPAGTTSYRAEHRYMDDGLYTVTILVTDNDGGSSSTNAFVTVSNSMPWIMVEGDTIYEGGVATVSGTIFIGGTWDSMTLNIAWGDGLLSTTILVGSATFSLSHQYLDDGLYTVTILVTDDEGGTGGSSTQVKVQNLVPIISGIHMEQPIANFVLPLVSMLTFQATFTDAGTLDSHMAEWNWGDGSMTPGNLESGMGAGSVRGTHCYATPGIYTVTLTVIDDNGGSSSVTYSVKVSTVNEALSAMNTYIQGLPSNVFYKNAAAGKATMSTMITIVQNKIIVGDYNGAINGLKSLRDKFDGLIGGKSNNDLIKDLETQRDLSGQVDTISAYLALLRKA